MPNTARLILILALTAGACIGRGGFLSNEDECIEVDPGVCSTDVWFDFGSSSFGLHGVRILEPQTGGISNSGTVVTSSMPDIAINSSRQPMVAWIEGQNVFVRVWDDSTWAGLGLSDAGGGISDSIDISWRPHVALTSNDRPIVVWEDPLPEHILVSFWDGSNWSPLGESTTGVGLGVSTNSNEVPAIAIDADNHPTVAWSTWVDGGNSEIYVLHWNGAAWVELDGSASAGGVSDGGGESLRASVAYDSQGRLVVAWADKRTGRFETYVARYDTTWSALGPSLAAGGISNSNNDVDFPHVSMGVDGNDHPTVAWVNGTGGVFNAHARRWNGSTWEELAHSASDGGVSDAGAVGYVDHPSVAIDPRGRPVIAWQQHVNGIYEICLERWNGATWSEVNGSASGGCISNSDNDSTQPDLAIAAGRMCVTWTEASEVLVRCTDLE